MYNWNRKKQRGQRRKLRRLCSCIAELTPYIREEKIYEHFHVPCNEQFLDSYRTNGKVKTEFCKKWIEATEKFILKKPLKKTFCKVVAVLSIPKLWDSQIIIFNDENYYNSFWQRTDLYQKWIPIENIETSFAKKHNIATPLSEKGFYEIIVDEENGYISKNDLWFYGEL